jgi:hypothetical protein
MAMRLGVQQGSEGEGIMHVRVRVALVVGAVVAVLALGLPGLARAATTPSIADLQSPSHPSASTWYADANPTFTWSYSGIADEYADAFDQSATTVPDTGSPVDGLFGPQATYTAGKGPASVVLADVNGDGIPDLIVTNHVDDTVGVMLGNGDGTFGPMTSYDVGDGPEGVAVADLGNGHKDIIVANLLESDVSVLLGNGDGTFQSQKTYAVGNGPEGVAVADLGNGKQDLVVVNHGDNTVSVLLGIGDGTFQPQVTYKVGTSPYRVAIADLGNGHPDLVVTNYADNDVGVLLGNGDGTFQQPMTTYAVGAEPIGVAVGDFNGDGKPDLAVTNSGAGTVTILLGNGDGTFQMPGATYPVGSIPWGIVTGDFNGDGNADLAVTNHDDGTLSILLGNGDGTFQDQQVLDVGNEPTTVATADLNGDGHPDLAVANYTQNGDVAGNVGVLLGQTGSAAETGVADGTWYFHVRAHGSAGWGATQTIKVNIDTTPPVTTAQGLAATSPGWSKNAQVTLSATDVSSGVAYTYYKIDGKGQQTYSGPFIVSSGAHTVVYWSVDKAGNAETPHTGYIDVETGGPVTTASGLSQTANPAWTKDGLVTLTATDTGPGVADTYYTVDNGAQTPYTAPFTLPNGAHTVAYWSVDTLGNTEPPNTGYIDVDTVAPTLSLSGARDGAWLNHAVTLTLKASDTESGVASISYTVDGVPQTVAGATATVTLPKTPNATHTVSWTATDKVGNTSAATTVTVHVDTTGPTTSARSAAGRHGKAIALWFRVRDNLSPQASVVVAVRTRAGKLVKWISLGKVTTGVWHSVKWTPKASGRYRYTVIARDLAGNLQSVAGSAAITVR